MPIVMAIGEDRPRQANAAMAMECMLADHIPALSDKGGAADEVRNELFTDRKRWRTDHNFATGTVKAGSVIAAAVPPTKRSSFLARSSRAIRSNVRAS